MPRPFQSLLLNICYYVQIMSRDTSAGIATRCGLDRPRIESQWGRDFPHPSRPTMGTGYFPGVKQPGGVVKHPRHLAPRLKKKYSYTSTPPLVLRGLFQGQLYLYLYHAWIFVQLPQFLISSYFPYFLSITGPCILLGSGFLFHIYSLRYLSSKIFMF